MDYLSLIRKPIEKDLEDFKQVFEKVLTRDDGLLGQVLGHIRQRGGKRMRPIMTLLSALNIGEINEATLHSAVDWNCFIRPVLCTTMWWMRVVSVVGRLL